MIYSNSKIEKDVLSFLRKNLRQEFRVFELRLAINRAFTLKQIRHAIGRLRRKKLVAKRVFRSGRYFTFRGIKPDGNCAR